MQQTEDTEGKPRTIEGLRAVIFDFWMLTEFDELIITDYSSFSLIAKLKFDKPVITINPFTQC